MAGTVDCSFEMTWLLRRALASTPTSQVFVVADVRQRCDLDLVETCDVVSFGPYSEVAGAGLPSSNAVSAQRSSSDILKLLPLATTSRLCQWSIVISASTRNLFRHSIDDMK